MNRMGVVLALVVLVAIVLGTFLFLNARLNHSTSATVPTVPANATAAYEIRQRCNASLSGDRANAFFKELMPLLTQQANASLFGALLRRYYTCSKADAFNVYWS